MALAASEGVSDAVTHTQAVVAAARAFLNGLSVTQSEKVLFAFAPQDRATPERFVKEGKGPADGFVGERYGSAIWSHFPVSDVPRVGLQLGSLDPSQQNAAMRLLQVLLSKKGYGKVRSIMAADQVLADAGRPFVNGEDAYTISIHGAPSLDDPWMAQFTGHHLALNVVIFGDSGVLTPTLTGAQPALYAAKEVMVRLFADENDKAFALIGTFDERQRKQAVLNYAIDDLVFGTGHVGELPAAEGVRASAMTARQRALLLDVISEWAGMIDDAYAKPRIEQIKAGLDDTWFAWSGPTTHAPGRNGSAYYRVQGPNLLIEFAPQAVGGDPTAHVHTIYRDPSNDYGRSLTARQVVHSL